MATKVRMTQAWTKSGLRIPVTVLAAGDCYVAMDSKKENRIVCAQGKKKLKNVAKPQRSQLAKAGFSFGLSHIKELEAGAQDKATLTPGTKINPSSVLKIGDVVKITGISKGKGFTGIVKRYGFRGGPRTHGQSDRERAPGSIGSGTTIGRVFRNKRMAGRSGNAFVTVLSLPIIRVSDATGQVWVKGVVPGTINSPVTLTKTGEMKFEGLLHSEMEEKVVEAIPESIVTEEAKQEVVAE